MIRAVFNEQPDMVPVSPDISNMIPCKLTGKPFWDIHLYQDPPLRQAYIEAVRYFGFDGWLPHVPVEFPHEAAERLGGPGWTEAIIARTPERIYTRLHYSDGEQEHWTDCCNVCCVADPPTHWVTLSKVGLSGDPPTDWEDVEPTTRFEGLDAYHAARRMMGEDGVVGLMVGLPGLSMQPESVYEYYDSPEAVIERCEDGVVNRKTPLRVASLNRRFADP